MFTVFALSWHFLLFWQEDRLDGLAEQACDLKS
jgi:hypothetical protein